MRASTYAALLAACLIAGCAAHPRTIAPTIMSAEPYRALSCGQLRAKLAEAEVDQAQWEQNQKNDRVWDGVLNVLVIPGLGAVTPDNSKQVADAKGVVVALQREIERRCLADEDPSDE